MKYDRQMSLFAAAETVLMGYAQKVPLELFVFGGAMVEEILAPIPSPIVMTLGGSIALAQNFPWVMLLWLALIGAVGKTLGSWLVYFVSDIAEDIVVGKFGKFLGVSHKEIENIGKYFYGDWRDDVIILLARALPIMPTAPVSIACGVIKVNLRSYLVGTFFGTYFRNVMYLWLGFAGLASFVSIMAGLDTAESVIQMLMVALLLVILAIVYYRRSKTDFMSMVKKKLGL
jgi:membrane protein DedA with SNARE-associated domain